jgi:hypothetical protein
MRQLQRLLLGMFAACGFRPTASQPNDDATRATSDSSTGVGADAAIDAMHVVVDAPSTTPPTPKNCADAFGAGVTTNGTQIIDPDGPGGAAPYQVYCDQTTAGGGWTLVWVYGFTNYNQFTSGANAVTPRPTWGTPSGAGTTPTSTTVPTSTTTTGALDFAKWVDLGDEVMATSDINHWVKCQPGTGSVVTKTEGSITCQMVKTVPNVCLTTVPAYWGQSDPAGVGFYLSSNLHATYYFYEGYTTTMNWPTHDPCGANQANQINDASTPHGQLWIRHR